MSKRCRRSRESSTKVEVISHRQAAGKFFLSPTWNWPEFDASCCQECGRVIPMHETGWIMNDVIMCEECHHILEWQRTERQQFMEIQEAKAERETAALADEEAPEEEVEVEVKVEVEEEVEIQVEVEVAAPVIEPVVAAEQPAPETPLEEPVAQVAPIAKPETPALVAAVEPVAEPVAEPITAPETTANPQVNEPVAKSAALAHAAPSNPSLAARELMLSSPMLLGQADRKPPAEPDAPKASAPALSAATEPLFALTSPTRFHPRPSFAAMECEQTSALHDVNDDAFNGGQPCEQGDDALPLIDAMIPRFELTQPTTFDYRLTFGNVTEPATDEEISGQENGDDLPLIDAMIPRFELTEPEHAQWRIHFADDLLASQHEESDSTSEAAKGNVPRVLPLFDNMPKREPVAASPAKRKAKRPRQHPGTTRATVAPLTTTRANPLIFAHPVDQLLSELHNKQIDAQFQQKIRQSRQRDPFYAEVDTMLAAATVLRDQWMGKPEARGDRKSSAG